MLDHLRREQPAERFVRQRAQVAQRVAVAHVEAAGAAHLDHLVVEIDPARADAAGLAADRETRRGRSRRRARRCADANTARSRPAARRCPLSAPRNAPSNAGYFQLSSAESPASVDVLARGARDAPAHLRTGAGTGAQGTRGTPGTLAPELRSRRFDLALQRRRLLLHHRHRRVCALDPPVVALDVALERLDLLQELVRQPLNRRRQRALRPRQRLNLVLGVFVDAPRQRGELVVLRVDERRDALQVLQQRRMEGGELLELAAEQRDRRSRST